MKTRPWPAFALTAFMASCLAWLPRCDAAVKTRALAKERLLLARNRQQRTEPFIVSFRISINGGEDNIELAKNLSARINTPGSDAAGEMRYATARTYNGTFPPVMWPPSTTVAAMKPRPPTPPPVAGQAAAVVQATTPAPTAMQTALEALRIAKDNQMTYDKLTQKMTRATMAHSNALVYGNSLGTTPLPTLHPYSMSKRSERAAQVPHTLGRMIYDAFVNTPAPMEITTPAPEPQVVMVK